MDVKKERTVHLLTVNIKLKYVHMENTANLIKIIYVFLLSIKIISNKRKNEN
jgi:hypothetical protein